MSEHFYLFSSFKDNPKFLFDGYCFVDNDFIHGQEGAKEYLRKKNKKITGGEDGCYVAIYSHEESFYFYNDFGGYKKILYYYDPINKSWAVSNSINILVNHLRENGIRITLNLPQLYFYAKTKGASTQQLISFNTIANNIYLLPTQTTLIVGKKGINIIKDNETIDIKLSYEEMLSKYVTIWRTRFETIFSSQEITVRQALTGGIDSRAVFSISNLARKKLGNLEKAQHSFSCTSIRGDKTDQLIAKKISNHYGYNLNSNIIRNNTDFLSGEDTYNRWKDLNVGLYFPIYFDARKINPFFINVSGGGGEKFRPFYSLNKKIKNFEDFIDYNINQLSNDNYKNHIKSDMLNSMNHLTSNSNTNPLYLHYSEFRSRLHSGLFPQISVDISPLNSKLLFDIAKSYNGKVTNTQILYDLIGLNEKLLKFSFDKVEKAPSIEQLSNLTMFSENSKYANKGDLFMGLENSSNKKCNEKISTYDYSHIRFLEKDMEKAFRNKEVNSIWEKSYIKGIEKSFDAFLKNKKFAHAVDGVPISCFIASNLFNIN